MRRRDREVTEIKELLQIIADCKVCRIATQDADGLYIVPMNFGYTYADPQLTLFFHSAKTGRKIKALEQNNAVCFEMDGQHHLLEADQPCGYSYAFQSIIGTGQVFFIQDLEEKKTALTELMKHQSGQLFVFEEQMVQTVSIFKIVVDTFSGKKHQSVV